MKIRIHDTDFEGNPVDCTGEFFRGKTALDIVEGMKMNPFNAHLVPLEFMRQTLDSINQEQFILPDVPETAAVTFLQRLTILGFAKFELDDNELDTGHPAQAIANSEESPENKLQKAPSSAQLQQGKEQ